MSLTSAPIGSAVTDATTGNPVVTIGTATALTVTLVNNSGADIALAAKNGGPPATFGIYPGVPKLFTLARLQEMHVATPGWSSTVDKKALVVICTQAATWKNGQKLTLTIAGVQTDGPPAPGTVTFAPSDMKGNVPLSFDAPLATVNAPKPGSLPLDEALGVSLDSQGLIYRSDLSDPLSNKLFLNLKNLRKEALSTPGAPGTPQVIVSFVYGNTSGSLAPDDNGDGSPPDGSAWKIKVSMGPAQSAWTAANPRIDKDAHDPAWTLRPSSTNQEILGPADTDRANVAFTFSPVRSFTPAGHTQMLVLCTGFHKDTQTAYTDHLFVLDVIKEKLPLTRGLVSFYSREPVVAVSDPAAKPRIPLHWTMLGVAKVRVVASLAAVQPLEQRYADPYPVAYDYSELKLPSLRTSQAIFLTAQAFDGAGAYLNSLQFTTYADLAYVLDPGGRAYRVELIGDTYWMLENYAFDTEGSWLYGDDGRLDPAYGRLYDWDGAQAHTPEGWALPDLGDWNALVSHFGGGEAAFKALMPGGDSHFDARLGGQRTIGPGGASYGDMGSYGYYWASEGHTIAQFSGASSRVAAGTAIDPAYAISVRYIRHAT